jgi:hypothetical protein
VRRLVCLFLIVNASTSASEFKKLWSHSARAVWLAQGRGRKSAAMRHGTDRTAKTRCESLVHRSTHDSHSSTRHPVTHTISTTRITHRRQHHGLTVPAHDTLDVDLQTPCEALLERSGIQMPCASTTGGHAAETGNQSQQVASINHRGHDTRSHAKS